MRRDWGSLATLKKKKNGFEWRTLEIGLSWKGEETPASEN